MDREQMDKLQAGRVVINDMVVVDLEILISYFINMHDIKKHPAATILQNDPYDRKMHDVAVSLQRFFGKEVGRCCDCQPKWKEIFFDRVKQIATAENLNDIYLGKDGYLK